MELGEMRGLSRELKELADRYEHLRLHLEEFHRKTGVYPELVKKPETQEEFKRYRSEKTDIIYRTEGMVFSHLHKEGRGIDSTYYVIEPRLRAEDLELYRAIRDEIFERAFSTSVKKKLESDLEELFSQVVSVGEERGGLFRKNRKFVLSEETYHRFLYHLKRDIVGMGPLDPLLKDKTNEDIHVFGPHDVHVDNKIYGMMSTNVGFESEDEYKRWLRSITERMGKPASDASPIVDTTLPDGSRLNVVYSDDVSIGGPSITIRQFEKIPLSAFQLVKFGTMSPELAAYLWLCVENNQSIAVCGETAAGKTSTLNAITAFIPEYHKIVTVEDTLEIRPPHEAWQRLLTRDRGGEGSVALFDLIVASLRCRPDNIIVGEVRGREGFNVFQAMQTGHPTLFTFHAGNIVSLVHRFTGKPLNVPEAFFGNLNVCVFQNFVKMRGREMRRVTSVHEIEGYSKHFQGIVTRLVFDFDPINDVIRFLGKYNSYILEEKVAPSMGYSDPREIYEELGRRASVIRTAVRKDMVSYADTLNIIRRYQREGLRGLPFKLLD